MTMTEAAELSRRIEATLASLATLLAEDGAQLRVRRIDTDVPAVDLALDLISADCEECVMPHAALRSTIGAALQRETGVPVGVTIDDPREASTPAPRRASAVAGFAVLDVAEFSHQIRRSAVTIAVIAAVIAIMHATAALLAEQRRTGLA